MNSENVGMPVGFAAQLLQSCSEADGGWQGAGRGLLWVLPCGHHQHPLHARAVLPTSRTRTGCSYGNLFDSNFPLYFFFLGSHSSMAWDGEGSERERDRPTSGSPRRTGENYHRDPQAGGFYLAPGSCSRKLLRGSGLQITYINVINAGFYCSVGTRFCQPTLIALFEISRKPGNQRQRRRPLGLL